MKNIALIDCESINSSTSTGVICSVGGILLSPELEQLDSFEFFCRNKPGHVPDPYSMWVNKGFHKMMKSNMSHLNMMYEFHRIIKNGVHVCGEVGTDMASIFLLLKKKTTDLYFPFMS